MKGDLVFGNNFSFQSRRNLRLDLFVDTVHFLPDDFPDDEVRVRHGRFSCTSHIQAVQKLKLQNILIQVAWDSEGLTLEGFVHRGHWINCSPGSNLEASSLNNL